MPHPFIHLGRTKDESQRVRLELRVVEFALAVQVAPAGVRAGQVAHAPRLVLGAQVAELDLVQMTALGTNHINFASETHQV